MRGGAHVKVTCDRTAPAPASASPVTLVLLVSLVQLAPLVLLMPIAVPPYGVSAPFRAMLAPVLPRAAHSALRPVPHPRMPRPASSRYARGSGKCSPSSGPCIFLRSNCEARVGSVSCSGCTFMGASVSRPLAPPCVGAPARGNAQGPQLRCGDSRMWSAGGVAPDVPRVRACARGPMTTEGKERVWSARFLAARSG